MKQILIQKNSQIKELSGSRIEFYHRDENPSNTTDSEYLRVDDDKVTKVTIPFKAKVLSGGTLDLDFTLPEHVAEQGVSLLGSYWNGSAVTVYLRALAGFARNLPVSKPIIIGTLVQVTTMKQIETDLLTGNIDSDKSGPAIVVLDTKQKRKRTRK